MEKDSVIELSIGEKLHKIDAYDITPETTLNTYLRDKAHLTGTKRTCLEGGCGACIVAVEHTDPITKTKRFFSINSCLVSIFSCHGWKIHTIEGIGGPLTGYHPLQKKLAEGNGSQCGYCSSGMIMNMYSLINSGKLTVEEIENAFAGNICRCTGYRPILDVFKSFASMDIEDIKPCNQICNNECANICGKIKNFKTGDDKVNWMKFYNLSDLLQVLSTTTRTYMLVAGNTARGVYRNIPPINYYDVTSVKELISWSINEDTVILGGNLSLNQTIQVFKTAAKGVKFNYLSKVADHLDLVANIPVRNIGTLAGNLMLKYDHPEFQSDIFLILETINAKLVIVDVSENETITCAQKFLKTNMYHKVIKQIIIPGYDNTYKYTSYKIMARAQNTKATVNAGFLLKIIDGIVKDCRIVYGGINPEFVHASNTQNYLVNKNLFDNAILKQAYETLNKELKPNYVLPDFKPEYRKNLAISLFYKFVLSIAPPQRITAKNKSGGELLQRPISSGVQEYSSNKDRYPLSKPMVKLEALSQTSGQADYIEDMPDLPEQLFCSFVLAKSPANSVITKIDTSKALKIPGVVKFFGKEDIPGSNVWTPTTKSIFTVNEYLFCEGTVLYYDQPVGIIVANNQLVADKAADLVAITFTPPTSKPLLNIKDVLNAPIDVQKKKIIHQTDVVPKRKGTDIKKEVKGDFYIGLQYHFHMETQMCNVVPRDDGLDVYTSTQWIDCNQVAIANVLNIKNTQVNIKVKRLGGAFGAKIMRNGVVSCAVALAAYKLRKPVKMRMSLEKNMRVIGKRYPLYVQYDAGVNAKGVIQYLNAKLYSDFGVGGNEPVDSMLVDMFQNCYISDTWSFSTYVVNTETHANCWTRAPGTKEGLCAIEAIMEHIALSLGIDSLEMKLANTNQTKHKKIVDFNNELQTWANIKQRKQNIEKFNNDNRWRKRGMSIVPMAWVLEVLANYVSLVSIFHGDGSVAIAHGGIEMGQGINTKVAQVAAYKLGIPMDMIQVKSSSTLCNPNNTSTGGSLTSEAVCYATMKACEILIERMAPTKKTMKNPTWPDLVKKCFDNFVNLSASSFYSPNEPNIKEYYIYGLAAVEVEIDILTGKNQILQVDILEDVGDSMNPIIDIGQLEGAFVMGIGYYTTEDIVYNDQGEILTDRTWTYTPPGAKDIPIKFNIKFPSNIPNDVGVLQSKAIAEPPSCLSCAVPLAIRHAVASARKDADPTKQPWYPFDGCSSIDNIFLNSLNDYNQYVL